MGNRKRDVASADRIKDRLRRESGRLLSDLAYCQEFISRDYLRSSHSVIELKASELGAIHSAHWIYFSCEECAISATARLWEDWKGSKGAISLPMAWNKQRELWGTDVDDSSEFETSWRQSYDRLHCSVTKTELQILRDEELGHNIVDSGKRLGSDSHRDLGEVGDRTFLLTNGDILNFCEDTARLLFQTVCAFGKRRENFVGHLDRFEESLRQHRKAHGAFLDLLKA